MENIIVIEVNEEITVLAGPDVGEYFYDMYEDQIYLEDKNIIRFSENITTVVPSFFTGFFKKLVNDKMNPIDIQALKDNFCFEERDETSGIKKAFDSYLSTME